jgi:hypothetical protein
MTTAQCETGDPTVRLGTERSGASAKKCQMQNEIFGQKNPIGPTTPKPMGSREKGGNIMGAICSFLYLCKHSANILR